MNIPFLILQLFSGLAGGNLAAVAFAKFDLGRLGNSTAGILGGAAIGQVFRQLADMNVMGVSDISVFLGSMAGGSTGGVMALVFAGWFRNVMSGRPPF